MNDLGEVVARYVYSDGDGARQNGVDQLATHLGANQDTSLPFSGSNVPEAIELLDASGAVTQTLVLSTNQVGSVQLVTDAATGEVVQRIEYDEFGRTLADSAPGMQPFGFAGGLYDAETGLVRFGARDYASNVGRWIARDPVRFGGEDLDVYAYRGNDVLNGVDPTGLFITDMSDDCIVQSMRQIASCSLAVVTCTTPTGPRSPKTCVTALEDCYRQVERFHDKCNPEPPPPPDPDGCEGASGMSGGSGGFPSRSLFGVGFATANT